MLPKYIWYIIFRNFDIYDLYDLYEKIRNKKCYLLKNGLLTFMKHILYPKWKFKTPKLGNYFCRIRSKKWCFCGNPSLSEQSKEIKLWSKRFSYQLKILNSELATCHCMQCLLNECYNRIEPQSKISYFKIRYSVGNQSCCFHNGEGIIENESYQIIEFKDSFYILK